jgi:2-C-methyl-D-erythritol 2,4-cyclodiphosphate synthase
VTPAAGADAPLPRLAVGLGVDMHRFSDDPGRALVLGGTELVGERGLEGHSDADAVAHACADALLGAAGLGDLGQHFPDTDPRWSGADSIDLLRQVAVVVRDAGWDVANLDCTVLLEAPKLAPHRDAMITALSDAVGAPVHVKATRAEQMGAIGRGEGVVCWAVALVTST